MNKKFLTALASVVMTASLGLSGCQFLTGYNQISEAEKPQKWVGEVVPVPNEVNIVCAGTYHCEITKIDQTLIVSTETHKPVNPKLLVSMTGADGRPYTKLTKREQEEVRQNIPVLSTNKSVRIVPLSSSSMPNLMNYYASVKPIKREVHVNFYPENNTDYIERFAIIDEFKEPGTYVIQAYQKKSSTDDSSLLDSASPNPLCIDFLKDNTLQRRFCKQVDTEHQGEFVETKTFG